MFTSRHWPQGAAFLDSMVTMGQNLVSAHAGHAPVRRQLSSMGLEHTITHAEVSTNVWATMDFNATLSNHQRLPLDHVLLHAHTNLLAFARDGAMLPGLLPHKIVPFLSHSVYMGPENAYNGGPNVVGNLFLHDRTTTDDDAIMFHPGARFGGSEPFERVAARFLNLVDLLCDHTPDAGAPAWIAAQPAGPHLERMDTVHGPFLANTATDAAAIFKALRWEWGGQHDSLVFFQTDDVARIPCLRAPLRFTTHTTYP